jgi:hypothetical protein
MSYDFTACKNSLASMEKTLRKTKFSFLSPILPACYLVTAGKIEREIWWINQEFSSVDIIPPWFSMLKCHLEEEQ